MIFNDTYNIEILDISHHQGYPPKFPVVDFSKMKLYGIDGCIMRASHGSQKDNAFEFNWPACKHILPRSSYSFYENHVHPNIQAEKYWSILEHDPEGMLFLDLEEQYLGKYYHWDYWYQWLERLKVISGKSSNDIGIYVGHYYWIENTRFASITEKTYFKQYKRWYPWYFNDPFHPIYAHMPTTFPWEDSDVLTVQTGTPVIGEEVGVYSEEVDYNKVNGLSNFLKIFPSFSGKNDLTISIRRSS